MQDYHEIRRCGQGIRSGADGPFCLKTCASSNPLIKWGAFVVNSLPKPPGGCDPVVIRMGAVMANAVYDATGVRMLQLFITRRSVSKQLCPALDG